MDPRFLDVLHDRADQHLLAVRDRVNVDLRGLVQELIDEHRFSPRDSYCFTHVAHQLLFVVHDLHRSSAEHVGWADEYGEPYACRDLLRFVQRGGVPALGLRDAHLIEELAEPHSILRHIHLLRIRAHDGRLRPEPLELSPQGHGEIHRRLATELHHHAVILLLLEHVHHILEG